MWSCCIHGHVKRAKEKVIMIIIIIIKIIKIIIIIIITIIIIIIIITKDLEIETERMWGMKATTITVAIGVLGLI